MSQTGATSDQRPFVRAGAKSCAECRRRKIRCLRSSNDSHSPCDNCFARGKSCIAQLQRPAAPTRVSARERIRNLEQDMASLVAIVRESKASNSDSSERRRNEDSTALRNDPDDGLDHVKVADSTIPSHLQLLFSTFAGDTGGVADDEEEQESTRLLDGFTQMARERLQPLLPLRGEVTQVAKHASGWMALHYALTPAASGYRTGDQLVADYDHMHRSDVHPVALAMYLLAIAVTAATIPLDSVPQGFHRGRGVSDFVDAVGRTVESTIIGNNAFAGTVEGLQSAILYVRLSLSRGNIKGTWLVFRRIVALAELLGLPQASYASNRTLKDGVNQVNSELESKVELWEAISVMDRTFSMMLNLPPGTFRYQSTRNKSIWRDGQVSASAYNYQLSNLSAAVFEIDESYAYGAPQAESYEKVLRADEQLRALASSATEAWWDDSTGTSLDALLVKFWHYYTMARIHLRPSLTGHSDEQHTYSWTTCLEACRNAVSRFPKIRARLPSAFFGCDVQAYTASTVLLLSLRQTGHSTGDWQTIDLVQQVIDCFASVSNQAGAGIARQAVDSLTSLVELIRGQNEVEADTLTLHIPLLGKFHMQASLPAKGFQSSGLAIPSSEASGEYHDTNLTIHHPPDVPVTSFDMPTAMPMEWFFEFDDTSFWPGGNLLPQYTMGMDYWMAGPGGPGTASDPQQ